MQHRSMQFQVAKVAGTFGHTSGTGGTLKVSVVGPESHVKEAADFGDTRTSFKRLWVLDFSHGHGPDFVRRKQAETDTFNFFKRDTS